MEPLKPLTDGLRTDSGFGSRIPDHVIPKIERCGVEGNVLEEVHS